MRLRRLEQIQLLVDGTAGAPPPRMSKSISLVLLFAMGLGMTVTTTPSAAWAARPRSRVVAAAKPSGPNGPIGRTIASWRANRAYERMMRGGGKVSRKITKLERLEAGHSAKQAARLKRLVAKRRAATSQANTWGLRATMGAVSATTIAILANVFAPVSTGALVFISAGAAIAGFAGYFAVLALAERGLAVWKAKTVRTAIRKATVKDAHRQGLIKGEPESFFRKAGWLDAEADAAPSVRSAKRTRHDSAKDERSPRSRPGSLRRLSAAP
jgi:hypothetical protein